MTTDDQLPIPDIAASNARFDAEHGDPYALTRIRCGWSEAHLMRNGKLTDRRIKYWKKNGFYGGSKTTTKI